MSNGSRSGGGGGSKRHDVPESAVQEKLSRIRARRAERAAMRDQGGGPSPRDDDDDAGDEGEATQAFSVDDFDLPPEAAPVPSRAAPRGGRPAPPPAHDDDDDEGEKTAMGFSLEDFGLAPPTSSRSAPAPPPQRAPAPPPPQRAAAPPARAPEPPPRAPVRPPVEEDYDDDEDNQKTAAFSLDDLSGMLPPARPAPAPAPAPDPEESERTAAIDLDEFNQLPGAPRGRRAPADHDDTMPAEGADKTMMVDLDDLPQLPPRRAAEPVDPGKPAELSIAVGADIGKRFTLDRDVVLVGRGLDADFVINDASASRRHFNVVKTSSGYKLVDLGSGNGTKLNGERVKEVALTDGMRIEAGQTTLVFHAAVPPSAPAAPAPVSGRSAPPPRAAAPAYQEDEAEKTQLADMAALEIDPDWEARRLRMQQQAAQAAETSAQPVPRERKPKEKAPREPKPDKQGGGGGKVALLVGGFVLLAGGGFVAADKFGGLGIIFPKDTPTVVSTPGGGAGDSGAKVGGGAEGTTEAGATAVDTKKAKDLVAEAEIAYTDKHWHEARRLFKEALAIAPKLTRDNGDPVEDAVIQVDDQLAAWGHLVEARKLAETGQYAEALEALKKIMAATAYHADAQELLPVVRDELVGAELGAARQEEEKGDYESAMKHVSAALAALPDDPDALAIKGSLERATAPDADNLENEEGDTSKPALDEKVAKTDMAPGFKKYAAGEFMEAIDFFDGITYGRASRGDKAKAKVIAGAITKFETVWRAGKDALTAGELDKAVKNLRLARKFDATVSASFGDQLNQSLAEAYAKLAKAAAEAKDLTVAGSYAKQALAAQPDNSDAKAIADEVEAAAKGWLEDAKAAAVSNPDKAMILLARVLEALPEGDAAYKEAYALLNKLAKPGDE